MSLLNLLQSNDPAINNGLLNFGLSLLQSKGSFGNAVGRAGQVAQLGARDFRQQQELLTRTKLNDSLLRAQIEQQQRQMAQQGQLDALAKQYARTPEQQAMAQNGGPTVAAANAVPTTAPGFDFKGYSNAVAGVNPMLSLQMQQLLQKQAPQVHNVGPDGTAFTIGPDGKVNVLMKGEPKPKDMPSGVQEYEYAKQQGYRGTFEDWKEKNARAGAAQTNVSYGSLTPVQLPDGTMAFAQGSNRGGAQIVPGMKPPPQNRDTKLPAELQRMQIAGDTMVKLMDDYEGLLKKHNPRDPMTQANPTVRADMQSLKRNIELQFKELQALGALAGPDIEIMRQSLADPFTFSGAYYGREGLLAQVKRARELVKTRSDAVLKSQGKEGAAPAAAAPVDDPLGLR